MTCLALEEVAAGIGGQEALDDLCRNSGKHLIPDSKKPRTSMMRPPQHSKHDWGYPLYPPYFSVVGVHVARNDGVGYQGAR